MRGNSSRHRAIGPATPEDQDHEGCDQRTVEGSQAPGPLRRHVNQRPASGPQGQRSKDRNHNQRHNPGPHQPSALRRRELPESIRLFDAFGHLPRPASKAWLDNAIGDVPGDGREQDADRQREPPIPQRIDAIGRVYQLCCRSRDPQHQQIELTGYDIARKGP